MRPPAGNACARTAGRATRARASTASAKRAAAAKRATTAARPHLPAQTRPHPYVRSPRPWPSPRARAGAAAPAGAIGPASLGHGHTRDPASERFRRILQILRPYDVCPGSRHMSAAGRRTRRAPLAARPPLHGSRQRRGPASTCSTPEHVGSPWPSLASGRSRPALLGILRDLARIPL
jgi:hypothetical protein